jgi:thiamine pyrophosphate-dependent acetolactate synthase large subunit-like protein
MGYGGHDSIREADVIIVLDCDVPWIPTRCKPKADARVFHIDVDPLKQNMPVFYINAQRRYRADAYTAVTQLNEYISMNASLKAMLDSEKYAERWQLLQSNHKERLAAIEAAAQPSSDGYYGTSYLASQLRKAVPDDTVFVVEAITNTALVADQIQATIPGSWINCGGGGLGWSGGAVSEHPLLTPKLYSSFTCYHIRPGRRYTYTKLVYIQALGVKLASDHIGTKKFVCQIVGDGSYLFSFPASVYWIAKRYNIPILTIVLNNNGWNAPRNSLLLVRPDGPASMVNNETLNISFTPTPDYAGIAQAAGGGDLGVFRTYSAEDLPGKLADAVDFVSRGTSAVFDAQLGGPQGKFVPK